MGTWYNQQLPCTQPSMPCEPWGKKRHSAEAMEYRAVRETGALHNVADMVGCGWVIEMAFLSGSGLS